VPPATVPPIGARLRAARRHQGVSVRGLAREIGVSASLISQIETDKSSPSVSTLYAITTALGISIEDLFGADSAPDASAANGEPDVDDDEARDPLEDGASGDGLAGDRPRGREPVLATLAAHGIGPNVGVVSDAAPADPFSSGTVPGGGHAPGVGTANSDRIAASGEPVGSVPAAAILGRTTSRTLAPRRDRRLGPVVTPDRRDVLTLDSGVTWELLGQIPHKHVDFLLITYQPGGSSSGSGLLMRHSGTEFGYVISGELTLTLGFDTHRLVAGDAVSFDSSTPHAYRNESTEPAIGVWFVLERSA
jgi:transcriptional regulator with XRE-family HTH domain/quercetin dioxygenase-like cupin family protein